MAELVEAVSRLACIDGAVLLNRDLEILGTGAFIKASRPGRTAARTEWKEWQLGRQWGARSGRLTLLGGTRHQSGAEFAWSGRDCVSIVISQDGAIAAFAWPTAERLPLVLRNVERFVM